MKSRQTRLSLLISLFAALATLGISASQSVADPSAIKSNVVIVRPQYHQKTREAFASLAAQLAGVGAELIRTKPAMKQAGELLQSLSRQYKGLATSPGHGTGWIWFPDKTRAFIVTNKHVAGQAGSVTIEFDNNRHPSITGAQVVYVDDKNDLALIEVPRSSLPRSAVGFELATKTMTEGIDVWAAGFPGTNTTEGSVAAYSLTKGIVSNADFPGVEGRAIAHTATIDPGNSGGPLLLEHSDGSYVVVGMNTWKWLNRSNVNLSIPAPTLSKILARALATRVVASDTNRLVQSLEARAEQLAVELGSSQPNYDLLNTMIAYSFVAERPQIIRILVDDLLAGRMSEGQIQKFLAAPLEVARETLWLGFFTSFSAGNRGVGNVRLQKITDRDKIAIGEKIRSIYEIAGKSQEIVWVWEHGSWKIANASFENVQVAAKPKAAVVQPPTSPAPQPVPTAVATKTEKRLPHSRWHLGAKAGMIAAGEATIESDLGVVDVGTESSGAFIVNFDSYVSRKLTVGGQLFYTSTDFGDGNNVTVTTFNATAKAHFGSGSLEFRPGISMGYQLASTEDDTSTGLGLGGFVEFAYGLQSRWDILAEVGFISQPTGGGDDFYLSFGPTFYLTGGIGFGR